MHDTAKRVPVLRCSCAWDTVELLSAEEISDHLSCLPRAANHFAFVYLFSHGTSQDHFSVIRLQRFIIHNMSPRFWQRVLEVTHKARPKALYDMRLHFIVLKRFRVNR